MINPQDFFYYMAGFSAAVIAVAISYVAYQLGQTLKIVHEISQEIKSSVEDVSMIRNGIKAGILSILQKIIGKGGDKA